MKTISTLFLSAILLAGSMAVSAATFGYWRFENTGNLGVDSGGSGLSLTPFNNPSSAALVASGPGQYFFTSGIPQTGQPNTLAVNFVGNNSIFGFDSALTNVGGAQFTVEAFINISGLAANTTVPIVAQWEQQSVGTYQKWILALRKDGSTGNLIRPRVVVSSVGNNAISVNAAVLSLSLNTDYYIALVYNNGSATFYLQDLSTGSLQAETLATGLPGGLVFSGGTNNIPLRIGSFRSGNASTNYFTGLVDEVRLSTNALGASDLLASQFTAPPSIVGQPQDQAVAPGATAMFNVVASGSSPLHYLWYSNGLPATLIQSGADLTSLVLSNASLGQSGSSYFVVVTNQYGSATSAPPAVLTVVDVSSPTIGYWRHENAVTPGLDSSGNGLVLIDGSGLSSVVSYNLPDTNAGGAGAYFSKTIPLTSQTNTAAIQLDGISCLTHLDWPSFKIQTQMSVEAYFNIDAGYLPIVFNPIASQWSDPSNEGWVFGFKEATPNAGDLQLRFAFSGNGANNWAQSVSQWTLVPGRDYYAAVTVSNGAVTFYLADLSSTNPVVQTQSYTATGTSFFDSTAPFYVGAMTLSAGQNTFKGVIDEMRLSRVALPQSALLYQFNSIVPFITQSPQSVMVRQSQNAVFNVTATGQSPLSYQWYNAAGPVPLIGETNTSLVLSNVTLGQSGSSYFVIVTNQNGQATSASALLTVLEDTIGYWRFENAGDLGLDSSSSGLQLTNFGSPLSYLLPASGSGLAGALFPKEITSNGQTNIGGLQLDGATAYVGRGYSPDLAVGSQMTLEAFFNAQAVDESGTGFSSPIASRWSGVTADKSWLLSLYGVGTNFNIRFAIGNGISTAVSDSSDWQLKTNHDYYVAAVFDSGNVKLYLKDLSAANSVMRFQAFTTAVTNIVNGGSDLLLGQYQTTHLLNGVLDEVRLSRTALSAQQLLLPAPATGVPSNLVAVAGNAVVTLNWSAASNAFGYKLKRATANGGPYVVIPELTSILMSTNYTDTNVVGGTTYYYVVAGAGAAGDSADSAQASATPISSAPAPTIQPPYVDATGTNLALSVSTVSGHNYILQSTPGLEGTPVWTSILTNSGTGGAITNLAPISLLKSKEFYRYLVE